MDRRRFLQGGLALLAGMAGAGRGTARVEPPPGAFVHGVASGDPLADRVILWTRLSGAEGTTPVEWRIARDPELGRPVQEGSVPALAIRDYTVKVDVTGLDPGTTYYYGFRSRGHESSRGRTRTLPVGPTERVRLAFASCSNLPSGFFNAYRLMARRADLDAVLHLGDYLYEYANGTYGDGRALGRVPEPDREIVTLADYRTRHAQYKRDPDLQEVHRQNPFVAVWDDHEITNNAWRDGAQNHDASEGDWRARREAAVRAYLEWMPVREAFDGSRARLQRSFRFGDLADLVMLDTRLHGRDAQLEQGQQPDPEDRERSLLGRDQEAWLGATLAASQRDGVRWRVLGQQVMLAPLRGRDGGSGNPDAWEGYPGSRERLRASLERDGVRDVVCLTGDVHSSWAFELPRYPYARDPERAAAPAWGVEFATPGITSPGRYAPPEAIVRARELLAEHPHLRWVDLHRRGYALLDLDRERAQAEWYFVESIEEPRSAEVFGRAFRTRHGESRLVPSASPSLGRSTPRLAP
jgi:alkaline phosphatase D